jgi:hypothetical protein
LKKWLLVTSAAAVLALGIWQWGSYGPFEVTVSTPGRNLEQVVVTLRHTVPGFSGHGSRSTYSETRAGRSNQPIRFPRRFVCFCLTAPAMSYGAYHPVFVNGGGGIERGDMRHFGVSRAPPQPVSGWREFSGTDVGGILDTWLYALETFYVPNARLPEPLIEEYLQEARREIFALPIPDEQRPPRMQQLSQIEAALRARAQR